MASWFYGPGGEGWYDHPSLVPDEPGNDELTEINELRARYRELAGKGGGPRWDEATYREKIAALGAK